MWMFQHGLRDHLSDTPVIFGETKKKHLTCHDSLEIAILHANWESPANKVSQTIFVMLSK
jgi:hypothetical protein